MLAPWFAKHGKSMAAHTFHHARQLAYMTHPCNRQHPMSTSDRTGYGKNLLRVYGTSPSLHTGYARTSRSAGLFSWFVSMIFTAQARPL